MSYRRKLKALEHLVDVSLVERITAAVDDAARRASEPWQRTLVDLLVDALQRHGPEGVAIAEDAVLAFLKESRRWPRGVTSFLILSTFLAQLQNAEAAKKERVRRWLRAIAQNLGGLLVSVLRGN